MTMKTSWATAPSNQITISFSELNIYGLVHKKEFFSSGKTGYKRIISNATGVVKAGTFIALMGPSGAGKSTLMSALAYRNTKGVFVDGDVRFNGIPASNFVHKISGFMHQEDLFIGTLTVREHLYFMASMKLPRTRKRRDVNTIVDEFLIQLGLTNCAENRIGETGHDKVLSGGEKKRLAFATELLTDPPVIFCDEPTTGLDAYSAQTLVHIMKEMAIMGKTIICTIHQPSSELFDMFTHLVLLTEGRIAFTGNPKDALEFFASRGYPCPKEYNPADFFIKRLTVDSGSEDSSRLKIKRLCDEFIVSEFAREIEGLVQYEKRRFNILNQVRPFSSRKEPFWFYKLFLLTWRAFLQVLRDPSVQAVRIIQKIVLALMAGLCYVGTVQLNQTGVQSVQGAVFILVTENTFSAMYSVLALFPTDRPLFIREFRNGLYSSPIYYLSKMGALLPGLIVEPVLFTIIAYWLVGLRYTFYAFFMTVFITIMVMNVSTACGCLFSNAFGSVSFAMACLVPFDYVLMITSGLFIKLDSMSEVFGWAKYLSWLMYGNEAMSILQWEGISNITCEYTNPDIPCLRDGNEVLSKFDFSVNHLSRDVYAMITLYLTFHFLGFLCLWWKTKND